MRELLHNATIINEGRQFHGFVEITDKGLIGSVSEGDPDASLLQSYRQAATDLHGHWLMPGVIDSHVHFREPGGEHKATIFTESRAAVAGGVTSFMEMPNTSPATTSPDALDDKFRRAANDSVANYSFYIGATTRNIETLKAADYSRIPGVKLFMGSSTGGMLVEGEDTLSQIFKLPILVAVHCEDESTIRANTQAVQALCQGRTPEIEWHAHIRSVLACCRSTAHALALAERHGTRLHIMHISTLQELGMLRATKARVTAEACMAHLLFDERDYSTLGTRIKCNPSVKGPSHRDALRQAVRQGLIATVSTDHAPHTVEEKGHDLFTAPSGMPMVQFSLPAMFHLALDGHWSIETVVQRLCHSQADIFGVQGRGYIRPGYHADLVEVDPGALTVINRESIMSKCGWSPLEGRTLRTKVCRTWVNGHLAWHSGRGVTALPGQALPLRFAHP